MNKYSVAMLCASVAACALATPAMAQLGDDFEVSANVAMVSDYRFRGVSLSDEDIAIQGGFDVGLDSGLYVGTWGSSIENFNGSEMELDVYAGYGFEMGQFSFDVGGLGYLYPGGEGVNYGEVYASAGTAVGITDVSLGVAYNWEQDNLGDDDNIYVFGTGSLPLGESGFSLDGSLGYTEGALDLGEDGLWDWSVGVSTSFAGVDLSVAYIDTSADDVDIADATAVITLSKSF